MEITRHCLFSRWQSCVDLRKGKICQNQKYMQKRDGIANYYRDEGM